MENHPGFVTGDTVRLKTGNSPITVLEVDHYVQKHKTKYREYTGDRSDRRWETGWYIRYRYLSSVFDTAPARKWRRAKDFVHIDKPKETEEMSKLYQTKETEPRFGTFLTRNSLNQIVLEMKGSQGEVLAFNSTEVEEVMPYTVEMKRFSGDIKVEKELRHYQVEKGSVEVGDVLLHLSNGNLWEVQALDTRRRDSSPTQNGFFKMQGDRIGVSTDK